MGGIMPGIDITSAHDGLLDNIGIYVSAHHEDSPDKANERRDEKAGYDDSNIKIFPKTYSICINHKTSRCFWEHARHFGIFCLNGLQDLSGIGNISF